MKIKQVQMLLPLKYPKKKAVQMTFRFFRSNDKPNKPVIVFRNNGSPQPINNKSTKLDKFL